MEINEFTVWSVSEYQAAHDECTGDFEDVNAEILGGDQLISVFRDGTYCVGVYDDNQTAMPLA